MGDSTHPSCVTDHDLVERVFDAVAALRDDVVERYDAASSALRQLRARAQCGPLGPRCEIKTEELVDLCACCSGSTRDASVAGQRDEACPVCGLAAEVLAVAVAEPPSTQEHLPVAHPLVSFLRARGRDAVDDGDAAQLAIAELVERILARPCGDDGRMWQRDVELLRIAAGAYSSHPDYDPAWQPS